jgi:hypothetical protein
MGDNYFAVGKHGQAGPIVLSQVMSQWAGLGPRPQPPDDLDGRKHIARVHELLSFYDAVVQDSGSGH